MRVRALIAAVVVVGLSATAAGTAATPDVRSKQAQAASVLAEINGIDAQLGHTVEAWNGANLRLASVERELKTNTAQLAAARAQYRVAQRRIARRLVAIYVQGEPDMVDVILGASNVGDLIDGLDAVSKVTAQDREIASQASALKTKLDSRERRLVRARAEQRATLADLTTKRAQIQSSLATRRRLLSSIQGQIDRIQAAQRAEEARLAAQARARLAREQAQAVAAAKARAAHQAAAAEPPPAATVTTAPTETTPADTTTTAQPPVPATPAAPLPAGHPDAASVAARYLGVPYVWGGATPAGFDCSGLVVYVYAQLGVVLPHYTGALWALGVPVPRDQLQQGDLVFFDALDHVGIYIGAGQFIHAPHTGDVVKVSTMSSGSYAASYVGARRI
ncbi:MAG TPA: NlpC/P60 family protein [Gaiellaceae bacterium]|nr:NlpC/P60 family protein [Gaiellaceae bacterium]